jgi:TolA-binding protein
MTKIYELNNNIEELLEKYYSCFDDQWEQIETDELVEELHKQLEEFQNKKDDLKEWALNKRQNDIIQNEAINLEIERLETIKKARQSYINRADKFLQYLFWDLEKNILFWNYKIWYRKSKAVNVKEDFNNPEYMKEKITISVDKTKIKKDIEAGKQIQWAFIEERKTFFIN